jgi:uncharacterized membrane protein YhaH (DUF805 family)
VSRKDIVFTISADSLPPRIKIESGARVDIKSRNDGRFDFGLLIFALVVMLIGISVATPIIALYVARPRDFLCSGHFDFIWWLTIPLIIAIVLGGIVLIAGLAMLGTFLLWQHS